MASNFYNIGLLRLLNGSTTFTTDTVKGLIVDNTYTFSVSHEYVANISGEVSGTGYARFDLTSKTVSLNATSNAVVFDCADLSFYSINTSNAIAGMVVYQDTEDDNTSPLLGFISIPDTTTNGSDLDLAINVAGLFEFTNNIA